MTSKHIKLNISYTTPSKKCHKFKLYPFKHTAETIIFYSEIFQRPTNASNRQNNYRNSLIIHLNILFHQKESPG